MFDTDKDKLISHHEIYDVVFKMYSKHMNETELIKVSEIFLNEIDQSKMGSIMFNDYAVAVKKCSIDNRLMLQFPQ